MLSEIISLIIATSLLLGSPGPAPLTLAAVSSTFGFRVGMRFLFGILLGLMVVIILTGLGVSALLNASQLVKTVLRVLSVSYLLFIAYKIAFLKADASSLQNAPSIKDGFVLNILNPKAYAAFLAIFSTYRLSIESALAGAILTGVICFICACLVDFLWVYFGAKFSSLLQDSRYDQKIRYTFALLILATLLFT